ncbi:hypothetical protein CO656_10285 [Sinorhizobium sp. FG01]|uniref:Uncharacterized protein n=1 Tax=Sinorhizobium americanum TaxID=194963 RepID=A0A2S3YLF8_9HYPH|nr:hypothetical protein CO656_10285 [Sinorhizobium sp. FG01]POH28829.1 hypothetical protein ATY31_20020 [Sinorhizobium americanum]
MPASCGVGQLLSADFFCVGKCQHPRELVGGSGEIVVSWTFRRVCMALRLTRTAIGDQTSSMAHRRRDFLNLCGSLAVDTMPL